MTVLPAVTGLCLSLEDDWTYVSATGAMPSGLHCSCSSCSMPDLSLSSPLQLLFRYESVIAAVSMYASMEMRTIFNVHSMDYLDFAAVFAAVS